MADYFPALPQPYEVTHPEQGQWTKALDEGLDSGQNYAIKQYGFDRRKAADLALAEYGQTGDPNVLVPHFATPETALGAPAKSQKLEAEAGVERMKYIEHYLPLLNDENYQQIRAQTERLFPDVAAAMPAQFSKEWQADVMNKMAYQTRAKAAPQGPVNLGQGRVLMPDGRIVNAGPTELDQARIGYYGARADRAATGPARTAVERVADSYIAQGFSYPEAIRKATADLSRQTPEDQEKKVQEANLKALQAKKLKTEIDMLEGMAKDLKAPPPPGTLERLKNAKDELFRLMGGQTGPVGSQNVSPSTSQSAPQVGGQRYLIDKNNNKVPVSEANFQEWLRWKQSSGGR
jgi:hypothetical protein